MGELRRARSFYNACLNTLDMLRQNGAGGQAIARAERVAELALTHLHAMEKRAGRRALKTTAPGVRGKPGEVVVADEAHDNSTGSTTA